MHTATVATSDLQHYLDYESGTRLQLPGYPDPVSNSTSPK